VIAFITILSKLQRFACGILYDSVSDVLNLGSMDGFQGVSEFGWGKKLQLYFH